MKMGKRVIAGKLVQTDTGAIWTIPQNEVLKIRKSEEGTVFSSGEVFRRDSGFEFGLGLASEGGKVWRVKVVNINEVPVKLEGTLIIQQEREVDVKVSRLPGDKAFAIEVPQLFADTRRGLVVEVRLRSWHCTGFCTGCPLCAPWPPTRSWGPPRRVAGSPARASWPLRRRSSGAWRKPWSM